MSIESPEDRRVVVTGATGFLGRATCHTLRAAGYTVLGTGRNAAAGAQLQAVGVQFVPADITDAETLTALCAGAQAVVHCAALCSPWGSYAEHYAANVRGTEAVLQACDRAAVSRLVHVSTPSLYFRRRDQFRIDERAPLPKPYVNHYTRTKALAEARVVAAPLDCIILRPKAIFGPGDTTLMPRLIGAARRLGSMPLFGRGDVWIDLTYVDNVSYAILLALRAGPQAVGRAFNITNGEPVNLEPFLQDLLPRLGVPMRVKRLPRGPAYAFAALSEAFYKMARPHSEPPLTRYTVGTLGYTQTLSIAAAAQWLGYAPQVRMPEALEAVVAAWEGA